MTRHESRGSDVRGLSLGRHKLRGSDVRGLSLGRHESRCCDVRGLSLGRHESQGSESDACRAYKRSWAMMIFSSCR